MGLVAVAVLAVPGAAFANQSHDCGNGRSITLTGSNSLWPPNHKYHPYTVTAIGNSTDLSTDMSTMITSNEPDVGIGAGGPQHAQDANPFVAMDSENGNTAHTDHQLRAERSGAGSGRTYTFKVHAFWNHDDFTGANSCDATFTVSVPHDQGHR